VSKVVVVEPRRVTGGAQLISGSEFDGCLDRPRW
jgi:hypothetical protein